MRVFPFGVSRTRLEQAVRGVQLPVMVEDRLEGAHALITLKNYYRRKPQVLRDKSTSRVRARLPGRFCRGASREKWRDAVNRN